MTFKILFNRSDLERSRYGAIWGGVWIELHGVAFPEKNWNDMPVAFMAELMDALRESPQPNNHRRVRFYDGPFWIDLAYDSPGAVQIAANDPRLQPEVATVDSITHSVASVASALAYECNDRDWSDQGDVQRLAALL